jgi:hypothetical protein
MEAVNFQPHPRGTLEKGALLLEMAMRDQAVADTLRGDSKEDKLKLFARVGLSEEEFVDTIRLINEHFKNPIRTEAIFW